jgi:hypothetical protein
LLKRAIWLVQMSNYKPVNHFSVQQQQQRERACMIQ